MTSPSIGNKKSAALIGFSEGHSPWADGKSFDQFLAFCYAWTFGHEADTGIEQVNRKYFEFKKSHLYELLDRHFLRNLDLAFPPEMVRSHGLYVDSFCSNLQRSSLIKCLKNSNVDQSTWISLIKRHLPEFWYLIYDWPKTTQLRAEAILVLVLGTLLQRIAYMQLFNTKEQLDMLRDWYTSTCVQTRCGLCDQYFRVIDLPYWIYIGSNGIKDCCFHCPIVENPKKLEIIKMIPEFVKVCGFIPNANANPRLRSFTSRLTEENHLNAFRLWAKLGGNDHVKRKFGSWFRALALSGALPNGVRVTGRGIQCLARDSHECDSLDEKLIDDWLSGERIKHIRQPKYPYHKDYNSNRLLRADWEIDGILIEYFGMLGDKGYDERMARKMLLAADANIELIPVYPGDLKNLGEKLARFRVPGV